MATENLKASSKDKSDVKSTSSDDKSKDANIKKDAPK